MSTMKKENTLKTTTLLLYSFLSTALLLAGFSNSAEAERAKSDFFEPRMTIGDGKDGRVWKNWRATTANYPIERVQVRLRKTKGGTDAYVNLRIDGGATFENGRRVRLNDNDTKTLSWSAGNVHPNGKQLVLNIYKGEAYVESVKVYYARAIDPHQKTNDRHTYRKRPYPGEMRSGMDEIVRASAADATEI